LKDFNLKNKLRAGLIGFGVMGKNHARILSNLDNVELIGIADPFIPNQIDSFLDGAHFYKDPVELLNQELDYAREHAMARGAPCHQGGHAIERAQKLNSLDRLLLLHPKISPRRQ
jgi:hypothetical protein